MSHGEDTISVQCDLEVDGPSWIGWRCILKFSAICDIILQHIILQWLGRDDGALEVGADRWSQSRELAFRKKQLDDALSFLRNVTQAGCDDNAVAVQSQLWRPSDLNVVGLSRYRVSVGWARRASKLIYTYPELHRDATSAIARTNWQLVGFRES